MREIKIKAWDGERFYMPILCDGGVFRNFRDFENFISTKDPLVQYTGLKDKNGVEIYEGDIVAVTNNDGFKQVWSVEFSDGSFCAYNQLNTLIPLSNSTREHSLVNNTYTPVAAFEANKDLVYCEVIGNIYENPDLPC